MGAPLRSSRKESGTWSDKRKIHVRGYQQHNYNIYMVAQRLAPRWNLAVLDGYEGMEGNGPIGGMRFRTASRLPPATLWPPIAWLSKPWESTPAGSATCSTAAR